MNSIDWMEVFKQLDKKKKRLLKVTKKGIRAFSSKRRFNSKETSPEEIEKYIRENNITTRSQLREKIRSGDLEAPSNSSIMKYYGSMAKLWLKVYGIRKVYVQYTADELVKLFVHLRVYGHTAYRKAKKKDKYLIPSERQILKHFGKSSLFWRIVKANSNESIFERYIALYKRSGKIPTKTECRKNGVEIDKLYEIMDDTDIHTFIEYYNKRDANEK